MADVNGPMSGVRVVEVAQYTLVPGVGALLSDWGADVIKVEPISGDAQRRMVKILGLADGLDVEFQPTVEGPNRGKRSIALDLIRPEAQAILMRLVETADVFMTNVMPNTRDSMGFGWEQIRKVNPRIVYASATGFGSRGPEAAKRAFDSTAFWARSGAADLATSDEDESLAWQPVPALGDNVGALAIAAGISAALFQRERTNTGTIVDVSLLSAGAWAAQFAINLGLHGAVSATSRKARRGAPTGNPLMSSFKTSDGRFLIFATAEAHRWWADFCRRAGLDELINDERFSSGEALATNSDEAVALVRQAIKQKDLAFWMTAFETFDAPWSYAQSAAEAGSDRQLIETGSILPLLDKKGKTHHLVGGPVCFGDSPLTELPRAPELGEQTDEILVTLGYANDEIEDLRKQGLVA
jgi:crotonobetainyl-CoA:carnitine CoA-transferase CaiB-like acyl-CoA transferase